MKKILGYTFVGIISVAILYLVYLFITKGYSKNLSLPLSSIIPSVISPSSETKNAVSTKVPLEIMSPVDGSTLSLANITIKGKTVPGAEVFINDLSTKADAQGDFLLSVNLDEGENTINISANDSLGNASEKTISVNVVSF